MLTGIAATSGLGNGLDNILTGNDAANRLDGRFGADVMRGGLGNDTYVVDQAGDRVSELAGQGTDKVESAISYTLAAALENLTLTGYRSIDATGNQLDNVLIGNFGVNRLDGRGGADRMSGGLNDDIYVVDNVGDVVIEADGPGDGTDTIESAISYVLGANLENLTLTGAKPINGTGNGLENILTGNSAANILDGGGGYDVMRGGLGNDTYFVDAIGDRVIEDSAGGGIDQVISSATFELGGNIENLTLTGTASNGTGNALANRIVGNEGANDLFGADGDDTLIGAGGNDQLYGQAGNNRLDGGAGDDVVRAGDGNDTMTGGSGVDHFIFTSPLDPLTNVDVITDYEAGIENILIDRDIMPGIVGHLDQQHFRLGTTALDADDRILYDSATGQIFYDADGVGGVAAIHFLSITPGTDLTFRDIIVAEF